MFSFGIVLCEILARITADPEILPRTQVTINITIDTKARKYKIQLQKLIDFSKLLFLRGCSAGLWFGRGSIKQNGQWVSSASFGAGRQLLSGKCIFIK